MEFIQGCRNNRELMLWKKVSNRLILEPITEEISLRARHLMELYSLSHGLQMGDALIAATVLTYDHILFTANRKHYYYIPGIQAKFLQK